MREKYFIVAMKYALLQEYKNMTTILAMTTVLKQSHIFIVRIQKQSFNMKIGRFRKEEPTYIGRSDTCLRNRLLAHAYTKRADYFDYNIQWTIEKCFIAECSAYHALLDISENLIHPSLPKGLQIECPFCRSNFEKMRKDMLSI